MLETQARCLTSSALTAGSPARSLLAAMFRQRRFDLGQFLHAAGDFFRAQFSQVPT